MDPSLSSSFGLHSPIYEHDTLDDLPPNRSSTSSDSYQTPSANPSTARQPLGVTLRNMPEQPLSSARLKRLSLVSKLPSIPSDEAADESHQERPQSARLPLSPGTPQRNRAAIRSSISYSPAVRIDGLGLSTGVLQASASTTRSGDESGRAGPSVERNGTGGHAGLRKTETLVDKHADLLTLIAQKERRVHELKEELAQQESSLLQLKERWTQLITRQTRPHVTRIRPSSSSSSSAASSSHPLTHRRQATTSPSGPASPGPSSPREQRVDQSPESVASPTSLDQSIANLLSNIPGESVGMEAVESGKRFWANLVKTVSAAAGGTVPELQGRAEGSMGVVGPVGDATSPGERSGNSFDLSTLSTIASALPSWTAPLSPTMTSSSTSPSAPAPARPRNAARLRDTSRTASSTSIETANDSTGSRESVAASSPPNIMDET